MLALDDGYLRYNDNGGFEVKEGAPTPAFVEIGCGRRYGYHNAAAKNGVGSAKDWRRDKVVEEAFVIDSRCCCLGSE